MASVSTAQGADSSETSPPAAAGPPSWAADTLSSSFELPSTSWFRRTSDGRYDWYATSKNTVSVPDDEADDVQLPDRERVERVRDRHRHERGRAPEVGDDEDRAPAKPVDPDAGGQREQQERQELDRPQQGDLERARVEHDDRRDRQRERRDLAPELADRLARPEPEEVRVPPQASPRPEAL